MDPLKVLSPSTAISPTTNPESINTLPGQLWEDMPSGFWDGARRMVHLIGWWPTPGTMTGAIMVPSRSSAVQTIAELRAALWLDCQSTTEHFEQLYFIHIEDKYKNNTKITDRNDVRCCMQSIGTVGYSRYLVDALLVLDSALAQLQNRLGKI